MSIDYNLASVIDNIHIPNWRERVVCEYCKLANRQRVIGKLAQQLLRFRAGLNVYSMERVTVFYEWLFRNFQEHQIIGSEYLGSNIVGGTVIDEIRHEDAECLSFSDDSVNLIISNDVFEHISAPIKAFQETCRVLVKGGVMLASIPFHTFAERTVVRAKIVDGRVLLLEKPDYHLNPVSPTGSLVYNDFSWDMMDLAVHAGFSRVDAEIYSNDYLGIFGHNQIIFRFTK
jgi:SAM-dependent methyltransferase